MDVIEVVFMAVVAFMVRRLGVVCDSEVVPLEMLWMLAEVSAVARNICVIPGYYVRVATSASERRDAILQMRRHDEEMSADGFGFGKTDPTTRQDPSSDESLRLSRHSFVVLSQFTASFCVTKSYFGRNN